MTDETGPQPTLLDELDARQDGVLAELEALNDRIEELLEDYVRPHREDLLPPTERAA